MNISITKDNVIYAKIFVCLGVSLFILIGILGILENNNKNYEMEAKADSDYALQVEAKILEITKQDINNVQANGYKEKVGEFYGYKVEYISKKRTDKHFN